MDSPLLQHFPPTLRLLATQLWSAELAWAESRGLRAPETADAMEDLVFSCDLLAQARWASLEVLQRMDGWIGSWDDLGNAVEEMVPEDVVSSLPRALWRDRYSDGLTSAADVLTLLWTRTVPEDGVWQISDAHPHATPAEALQRAHPMEGEPFSFFLARATGRLATVDAGLAARVPMHLLGALRYRFDVALEDLPLVLAKIAPLPAEAILRAEAPIWWGAIDDYHRSSVRAMARFDRLLDQYAPVEGASDDPTVPSMAALLAAPETVPIVLAGISQQRLLYQVYAALDAQPEILPTVMRYLRRFPLDFRAAFITMLVDDIFTTLEGAEMTSQLAWREQDPHPLDAAGWHYSRDLQRPVPRGLGRWGPPPQLQLRLQGPAGAGDHQ